MGALHRTLNLGDNATNSDELPSTKLFQVLHGGAWQDPFADAHSAVAGLCCVFVAFVAAAAVLFARRAATGDSSQRLSRGIVVASERGMQDSSEALALE